MKKKNLETFLYSTAGVAVMLVILIAFNVITAAFKQRVDLTEDNLYTLSDGTRAILQKIDAPVKIRLYCTRDNSMPVPLKAHAQRIEDLLAEFRQAAGGRLTIEKLDPQPDSDAEDAAKMDGVEGQMIDLGDPIYLGLSVTCLENRQSIPFLPPDRERLLEYDIARLIARTVNPEKPVLGVMSALPIFGGENEMMMMQGMGGRQEPWAFYTELQRDFEVRRVEITAEKIDDDLKVLLVVYPKDISEQTQFTLDQFVLRGGRLIAFLDPFSIADRHGAQNPMMGMLESSASMDKLLGAWGIKFESEKVVADMNFVTDLNRNGYAEPAPAVLSLSPLGINGEDALTSQLDSFLLAYAGVFSGTPAEGLTQTVLLKTTTKSQLIDKMLAETAGGRFAEQFAASGMEQPLAIRLAGKFKTAFPNGKPGGETPAPDAKDKKKDAAKTSPKSEYLKESSEEGTVILIGDADMLYDPLCVQVQNFFGQRFVRLMNGNLSLVQNMVEQLSGDSNLIGVRSRATMSRPFTVVRAMQLKAEENYRTKIKQLEDALQMTQQKVNELQASKEQGQQRFILSPEQQHELERFRLQEAETRRELKALRKNLRRDIDSLENRLKWVNILGMPLIVTITGITLALQHRRRQTASN
jgi:ABC-type uncharacterized transport system involved in gliding motility auxiliary subunit